MNIKGKGAGQSQPVDKSWQRRILLERRLQCITSDLQSVQREHCQFRKMSQLTNWNVKDFIFEDTIKETKDKSIFRVLHQEQRYILKVVSNNCR